MCLIVATKKFVAKTDLVVYKCLDNNDRKFFTPFYFFPVKFHNGIFIIDCGLGELIIKQEYKSYIRKRIDVIHEGVHAYTKKEAADFTSSQFPSCGTETHYAIIPKGCPYYIGINFDVVSTKMIVFSDKKAYDNYANEHDVKEI